ncbi:30S ribosome-binding factor RbfA [Enterobacteriaceae bacterium ET-AT1-13]|nr:30S ribosome-binding factor RbfA [Enterobacteriaceae bacterium ET-AT1-13]WGS66428.1 30S ribosome-binding factor RbfA [Enterobacteriaceae bacterium Cmel17]WMC17453.1 MAG: 30S ribosome-binding factor RbfA [Enterobacteriaceae bacterium Cmel21]WMC17660.1 MAG: 30S ribosome-binding factor RbfA [Enterobacteriaceae bacterium PSmelAO3-2]WMC17864.1 MAG: 30S ribosome-binding factor RbfA [Enterobacteriaceae bacterium PSmelAO3-1]WMC18068.1 MAG: 30S ribosome-binding factor RbfA [Enterobacteriaceae bacter
MIKKIRILKIEQQIYKKISIILKQNIKNSNKFIFTVTNVILSSNFMYAKIYITILNCILNNNIKLTEKKQIKELTNKSKYIRYLLGKFLNLKFIPNLIFLYDNSYKNNMYISSLIKK